MALLTSIDRTRVQKTSPSLCTQRRKLFASCRNAAEKTASTPGAVTLTSSALKAVDGPGRDNEEGDMLRRQFPENSSESKEQLPKVLMLSPSYFPFVIFKNLKVTLFFLCISKT